MSPTTAFTYPMQRFRCSACLFAAVFRLTDRGGWSRAYLNGGPSGCRPRAPRSPQAARAPHLGAARRLRAAEGGGPTGSTVTALKLLATRGSSTPGASYTRRARRGCQPRRSWCSSPIICAGIFFAKRAHPQLAAAGDSRSGAMVLSAIVIGGVYPLLVQQFSVRAERGRQGGRPTSPANIEDDAGGLRSGGPARRVAAKPYKRARRRVTSRPLRADHRDAAQHPPARPDQAAGTRFKQLQGFQGVLRVP